MRKQVRIHYRHLADPAGALGRTTLEAVLRQALSHRHDGRPLKDSWKLRAWSPGGDGTDTVLTNLTHLAGNHVFGDLTRFSRGHMQALLANMGDRPTVDVEQLPAPVGKEYLQALMYWMVFKNHVLLIQSASLGGSDLEQYFTWLLSTRTTAMRRDGHIMLEAKLDMHGGPADLEDIREIVVGNTVMPQSVRDERPDASTLGREERRTLTQAVAEEARAGEILRALFNSKSKADQILNSVPEGAQLEVSVHIGLKTRRRHVTPVPLTRALRNLPEGDIKARGKFGTLAEGDLRLMYPASILTEGNLLQPGDVSRAMIEAFEYFVKNGKIVA